MKPFFKLQFILFGAALLWLLPCPGYAYSPDAFRPDYQEADQGATGHGRSIKAYVDRIGTDNTTLLLTNKAGRASTTYTLSTSETIPSNITLKFERGAILSIDSGKTLTFAEGAGLYADPHAQCFSGSGAVAGLTKAYPQWWGASNSETSTSDESAIESAIASIRAGGTVFFFEGSQYYKIADAVTISKALTLEGQGEASEIRQATSNKGGFHITASNVTIKNLKLYGPQYATEKASEIAIYAYGADKDNYIANINLENCIIQNWGKHGIALSFVEDFQVNQCTIDDIYYAGIITLSARRGVIDKANVNNITGSPNAYGITLTRTGGAALTTYPRSSDITVSKAIVRGVSNWHGLDTHAGERISFVDCKVYDCKHGIYVTASTGASGNSEYAPFDCHVADCTVDSGVTNGSLHCGIEFYGSYTGGAVQEKATGSITDCLVRNCGDEDSATGFALGFGTTQGLVVKGNVIINPSPMGIYFYHNNHGFNISHNTIVDAWSDSLGAGTTYGIRAYPGGDGNNTGYIGDNSFSKDSDGTHSAATRLFETAIGIGNDSGNKIVLGPNYSEAATYREDAGDKCQMGKTGTFSTDGTGEDILGSTVIQGDTVGIKQTIHVVAAGQITGANGNKTVKFYFGAYSFTVHPAANDTEDWRCYVTIQRSASAVQRITCLGIHGTTVVHESSTDGSEDMTGDVTMKVTGECADAGDTITSKIWDVRIQ